MATRFLDVVISKCFSWNAQEVYSSRSIEQPSQDNHVKAAILKAYELVPEAYKQNFWKYIKKRREANIY